MDIEQIAKDMGASGVELQYWPHTEEPYYLQLLIGTRFYLGYGDDIESALESVKSKFRGAA